MESSICNLPTSGQQLRHLLPKFRPPGAVKALRHCTCAIRQVADVDALAESHSLTLQIAGDIVDMAATKLASKYL